MSAKISSSDWADAVQGLGRKRDLRYEPVGGINPKGAPASLCPGGTNRLTGELVDEFWGASCDADERETGGLFRGHDVLPGAVMVKAHMPDLATVVPVFHVESVEHTPSDALAGRSRRRVEFESVEFNRRFIATVPKDHDPIALRELFSPAFIDWTTQIHNEVDFGITEAQLFLFWRLAELSADQLAEAQQATAGLFKRLHREMEENNLAIYRPGPWNAGLEPFP